ncbi:MAG: nitrilase-related carbon-nitrogen hydrolase, partial [Alphaproteobacteria bacterium]|nr:nitrilase-related carbon-nitrogen hydrolase [Alphaproteobacteria bacterium]
HHEDGRDTYGHSLVVSPWGKIILDAGTEPGVYIAEIDINQVAESRAMVPSLSNERPFDRPEPIQL